MFYLISEEKIESLLEEKKTASTLSTWGQTLGHGVNFFMWLQVKSHSEHNGLTLVHIMIIIHEVERKVLGGS